MSLKYLHPKYISSIYFCVHDRSSECADSTSSLSVTLQTPLRRVSPVTREHLSLSTHRLKLFLGSVFIEEVRKPGRYATLYASLYGDPRCIPDACGTGTGFSNTIRWISAPHDLRSGHQLCPMGRQCCFGQSSLSSRGCLAASSCASMARATRRLASNPYALSTIHLMLVKSRCW